MGPGTLTAGCTPPGMRVPCYATLPPAALEHQAPLETLALGRHLSRLRSASCLHGRQAQVPVRAVQARLLFALHMTVPACCVLLVNIVF